MNANPKNVQLNTASYYVDISEEAMDFFRINYEMINKFLPKDVNDISSSSNQSTPNTLIIRSHSRELSNTEIINLVSGLFEHLA